MILYGGLPTRVKVDGTFGTREGNGAHDDVEFKRKAIIARFSLQSGT